MRKSMIALVLLPLMCIASAPIPYGALPTERQLRWHETELFALVCFGPNTFLGQEWGYGDVDPKIFHPAKFDARQIAGTLKKGELKGLIFVCKHHDGFCMWPTKTTDYNISRSPWKNGKGDMVKEFSDAAREFGMRFGVYCSPWDRNHAKYGTAEYLPLYYEQLHELLTQYGPIFETWFDGANGGDGYYGGARCRRKIDRSTYYKWSETWKFVYSLQPYSAIFGDIGPDCRWVGNERGYAAEDCWATYTPRGISDPDKPGNGDSCNHIDGPSGTRNGKYWLPPECDFPLGRGWYWSKRSKGTIKKPAKLMDIYFHSVGKGGGMNIGVAPNTDGVLPEEDCESLARFGVALREMYSKNFAEGAIVTASALRKEDKNGGKCYIPANVVDGDRYSYWAPEDSVKVAELVLHFPQPVAFDVVRLRENIKLGQRVDAFAIDVWQNHAWKSYSKGKSIGANRLVHGEKITTDRVRLRITKAAACPCISDIALFQFPKDLLK